MLESGEYPKSWKNHTISEYQIQEEYSEISSYFNDIGWHHYEISNWSKPRYESRHNQNYWNHSNVRAF